MKSWLWTVIFSRLKSKNKFSIVGQIKALTLMGTSMSSIKLFGEKKDLTLELDEFLFS